MVEDVRLVELVYLVFTRKPGESCRRRKRGMVGSGVGQAAAVSTFVQALI